MLVPLTPLYRAVDERDLGLGALAFYVITVDQNPTMHLHLSWTTEWGHSMFVATAQLVFELYERNDPFFG